MFFCKQCENKMYPLEEENKLYNSCNDCGFKEIYDGSIIERKNYKKKKLNYAQDSRYLIYDHSLPRTIQKQCPNTNCESNKKNFKSESIFIQDPISLKLTYVCTSCNVEWKYS